MIYQAFSRREVGIALLDARAGSPASCHGTVAQTLSGPASRGLVHSLREWERWCAELLESHLSYPILIYYRSQHERQSWLGALTAILDASALPLVGFEGVTVPTTRFTFAIARHAAVDLAYVYGTPPKKSKRDRLSSADFVRMRAALAEVGLQLQHEEDAEQRLSEIRRMYEPFVTSLADHLLLNLPPWIMTTKTVDDWQTSAWDHFALWSPEKVSMRSRIASSIAERKRCLAQDANRPIHMGIKTSSHPPTISYIFLTS